MIRNKQKVQRQIRIRQTLKKVSNRPRLSVHRSNKYCYAQVIDVNGNTLFGLSESKLTTKQKRTPMESAKDLGMAIAKLALDKKIKDVAFDKGRYAYHGRVKAIAEGAREGGLVF